MGENTRSWQPVKAVIAALCAALMIKLFVFDFMIAEGNSMEPAIPPGTVLVVNRLAYGFRFPWAKSYLALWKLPKKGDIVVFIGPQGYTVIKRCAEVSDGAFTALGDNAADSFDSSSYGPVPINHILGKVAGRR